MYIIIKAGYERLHACNKNSYSLIIRTIKLNACAFLLPCGVQCDMEISEVVPSSSASVEGIFVSLA